jgi:hypothetical protein
VAVSVNVVVFVIPRTVATASPGRLRRIRSF